MKTIVFAYGEFGCAGIEALRAAGYDIAAVLTHCDDPNEAAYSRSVAKLCVVHNLPAYTLEAAGEELVRDIAPEYIFSFFYRNLLPETLLQQARKGAYNLHPSLLPHYRGRAPINWVLVRGEKSTGVTLHHMVARADAGDIVAQVEVDIAYEDTAFTLQQKLLKEAATLLKEQLPLIARGKASRMPQDISKGNYCGRRRPADGLIDWTQPAESIRNLIRAVTQPFPGAFTFAADRKMLVWEAIVAAKAQGRPGMVLSVAPLTIACGEGALIVKAGQKEGGLYLSGMQLAQDMGLETGQQLQAKSLAA